MRYQALGTQKQINIGEVGLCFSGTVCPVSEYREKLAWAKYVYLVRTKLGRDGYRYWQVVSQVK